MLYNIYIQKYKRLNGSILYNIVSLCIVFNRVVINLAPGWFQPTIFVFPFYCMFSVKQQMLHFTVRILFSMKPHMNSVQLLSYSSQTSKSKTANINLHWTFRVYKADKGSKVTLSLYQVFSFRIPPLPTRVTHMTTI